MLISMIAAVGENLELGAGNALMWHLPDDFSWFIKHTKGKALIMGRKTMESLGKPLKNRTNIVLTSGAEVLPGFELASHWEQALEMAEKALDLKWAYALEMGEPLPGEKEIMIIGGGEIYKMLINLADKIELTLIDKDFEGDAYFPEIDSHWTVENIESHSCPEFDYSYITYIRK
jgi:dihydrofolate reductase